jgi:hypothetical protein
VRLVDIHSTRYAIARRYMIRLRKDDFNDPHELAKFAATAGMSLEEFRREFEYLVQYEPPPLSLDPRMKGFVESDEDHSQRPDPLARKGARKDKSESEPKAATT